MRPYPQYGDINVIDGQPGGNMKYQSLQIKLQKNFSKGYSFLFGYNYHYEQDERFFNDIAVYEQQYTWIDSPASRHRLTMAGSWEIPVGKSRQFLSGSPRIVDALVGGWNLSPIITWRSGRFLQFDGMVVNGDPRIDNPTPATLVQHVGFFAAARLYAAHNPVGLLRVDGTGDVQHRCVFGEVVRTSRSGSGSRLRMDSFNVLNSITWARSGHQHLLQHLRQVDGHTDKYPWQAHSIRVESRILDEANLGCMALCSQQSGWRAWVCASLSLAYSQEDDLRRAARLGQ